ncbi:penicillin-binding protein 2A [Thermoactinomyces sp. DSM 45891]|uniref:transglycosylase domain-containing protein n=1 Tax=Thermoactinomyces sp. DSM 45891 TaxID=1761907 RepID=UPI00090F8A93|nr:transglycosylase domain-containing protein [Thermoactinomyces sp. DSM 45891]SFX49267.1 penicillin-binding protein 2A [Thermoactinomyces sp. DSM 45891]
MDKSRRKSNRPRRKKRKLIFIALLTVVLLIAGGITAVIVQGKTFDLDQLGNIQNNSAIYDLDGTKVAELGNFQREIVSLNDIKKTNPLLPQAFLKVEDVRYYQHSGIDYYALGRAVYANLIQREKAQGASTITMQVAGNVILEDRRKTYARKVKEIATAWNLEQKYSKDQILEAYLNYIYFGNNVRGIQMASKIYFGKDVTKDRLTIPEIAFLAGLPKAPEAYNPYASEKSAQRAMERRKIVLNEMAEKNEMNALITEEEKQKALRQPLGTDEKYLVRYGKKDRYQPYKQFVLKELTERYGIIPSDVESRGFRIYTGINTRAQAETDRVLKQDSTYKKRAILDGGSATVDPRTGLIAAIGGGRHYEGQGFRINGQLPIQPGSAIKPLTVYAPAIEKSGGDINEYTIIPDRAITINGYSPRNYDRIFRGDVPLSEVVKNSLNAATVWLLDNKVGVANSFQTAQKLGLPLEEADKNIAPLALGGLTKGISPLQLAQAYTALANNGVAIKAHAVREVRVTENGVEQSIRPQSEPEKKRVFTPKTAYYMTRLLEQVVESGTGRSAKLAGGRPTAGKTGTTNNNIAAWFAGYTPQYVTVAMVYNTSKTPLENRVDDLTGGHYATTIFKDVMNKALSGVPIVEFTKPSGVEEPTPPYIFQAPQLQATYSKEYQAIQVNWSSPSDQVIYQLQRSEDGSNFSTIFEGAETSYTDQSIQIPGYNFTGGQSKTYYYRVNAIDSQTGEQHTSSPVKVEIKTTQIRPQQPDQRPKSFPPRQPDRSPSNQDRPNTQPNQENQQSPSDRPFP